MNASPQESLFDSVSGTVMGTSPMSFEDDMDDFGTLSDGDNVDQVDSSAGPKRKNRKMPTTTERRATHNAIERARRESLNGRFMELASLLPTMTASKRPSKNAIVSHSLEYFKVCRAREEALEADNARLRAQLNDLRTSLGMGLLDPPAPLPTHAPIAKMSKAKANQVAAAQPKTAAAEAVKPRSASIAVAPVKAAAPSLPAPMNMPPLLRNNSAPIVTSGVGPYLAHDPLSAASLLGFIDPFAVSAAVASSKPIGSPSSSSDADSSLVTTPISSYTSVDNASLSPIFYDDAGTASLFEDDLLAACGMPATFPAPMHGFSHEFAALVGSPAFPAFA